MGEGSDSARAGVLAARATLAEELEQLEASTRAAVDIPAKVKRNPVKSVGIAAGAGFLLVGGPRRLFRGAKRVVFGPPEPLPKSMLPKEIDKTLKGLGSDGEKVRGTIEREFAAYLEQTAPVRNKRDLNAVTAIILSRAGPADHRALRQAAHRAGVLHRRRRVPGAAGQGAGADQVDADATQTPPPRSLTRTPAGEATSGW